jgi:hypothetical protein
MRMVKEVVENVLPLVTDCEADSAPVASSRELPVSVMA